MIDTVPSGAVRVSVKNNFKWRDTPAFLTFDLFVRENGLVEIVNQSRLSLQSYDEMQIGMAGGAEDPIPVPVMDVEPVVMLKVILQAKQDIWYPKLAEEFLPGINTPNFTPSSSVTQDTEHAFTQELMHHLAKAGANLDNFSALSHRRPLIILLMFLTYPFVRDIYRPSMSVQYLNSNVGKKLLQMRFRDAVRETFGYKSDRIFRMVCEKAHQMRQVVYHNQYGTSRMTIQGPDMPDDRFMERVGRDVKDSRDTYYTKELFFNYQMLTLAQAIKGRLPVDWYPEVIEKSTAIFTDAESANRANEFFSFFTIHQVRKMLTYKPEEVTANDPPQPAITGYSTWISDTARQYLSYRNEITLPTKWKDLKELHDYVSSEHNKLKHALRMLPLPEGVTDHFIGQKDGITLRIAKSNHELIEWGQYMHNCIGGYADSAMNKTALLICAERDGKIIYNINVHPVKRNLIEMTGMRNCKPEDADKDTILSLLKEKGLLGDGKSASVFDRL